jgi:DNA-binding CsgD family transcriptional regulator
MLPAVRRGRPAYPDVLTPREWEVLALIQEGLTNPQIAQRLGITEHGARYHVSEILSKLGVESRQEAADWRAPRRPLALGGLLMRWGAGAAVAAAVLVMFLLAVGILAMDSRASSSDADALASPTPSLEEEPALASTMTALDYTSHGVYRLVPFGYNGPLPHDDNFVTGPPGQTTNLSLVLQSPLSKVPVYLPPGYQLAEAKLTTVGTVPISMSLYYVGPGFPIIVARERIGRTPVDIFLLSSQSHGIIEATTLRGIPAIYELPKPGTTFQVPIGIRFVDGDVETMVQGRVTSPEVAGTEFAELVKVAESMR